jgi:hypothetical protein
MNIKKALAEWNRDYIFKANCAHTKFRLVRLRNLFETVVWARECKRCGAYNELTKDEIKEYALKTN